MTTPVYEHPMFDLIRSDESRLGIKMYQRTAVDCLIDLTEANEHGYFLRDLSMLGPLSARHKKAFRAVTKHLDKSWSKYNPRNENSIELERSLVKVYRDVRDIAYSIPDDNSLSDVLVRLMILQRIRTGAEYWAADSSPLRQMTVDYHPRDDEHYMQLALTALRAEDPMEQRIGAV